MSASNWFVAAGLFLVAAAGGGIAYRRTEAPPAAVNLTCPAPLAPVVNVTTPPPKPYVCTPEQAEAGECLPLLKSQERAPTTKGPPEIAHVAKKSKPKPSAAKKLKSKWGAPAPLKLEDLLNAR